MNLSNLLNISDELNLYLTSQGVKPASSISAYPYSFQTPANNSVFKVPQKILNKFIALLDDQVFYYRQKDWVQNNGSQKAYLPQFLIGSTQDHLDAAVQAKMGRDFGLAMGFPKQAVDSFLQVIDGERRDGQYWQVCMAKAVQQGMTLPSWLAYISFVPDQLDIVNDDVSETTKLIGEEYQTYTRKHNPELACRVEADLFSRKLPVSWEFEPRDQSYNLTYDYSSIIDSQTNR